MNSFFPKIKIHPIIYIFIIISLLTGTFVHLFLILFIVLFHELGHYIAARFFNWRVSHIQLWIFGGVLVTEEHSQRPIHEQMIVTLAGPFQHLLLYGLIFLFYYGHSLSTPLIETMFMYNTIILLFNFLPIWPLDGGKLLFLLFCLLLPFRKAHEWTIKFSIVSSTLLFVLQAFVYPLTLSAALIMVYIILENWAEWRQRFYIFIRFLLQRFYQPAKKRKIVHLKVPAHKNLIDILSSFQISKTYNINVIYDKKEFFILSEQDCLESFFKEKDYHKPIGLLKR